MFWEEQFHKNAANSTILTTITLHEVSCCYEWFIDQRAVTHTSR